MRAIGASPRAGRRRGRYMASASDCTGTVDTDGKRYGPDPHRARARADSWNEGIQMSSIRLHRMAGTRSLRLLAVMATAVLVTTIIGGALPASAAENRTAWTAGYAGSATFREYGDHIDLCDHDADYHGVGVYVIYWHEDGGKREDWYWNGAGEGDCRDINLKVAEYTNIGFFACLADHTKKGGKKPVPLWNTCSGNVIVTNDNR